MKCIDISFGYEMRYIRNAYIIIIIIQTISRYDNSSIIFRNVKIYLLIFIKTDSCVLLQLLPLHLVCNILFVMSSSHLKSPTIRID